MVEVRQVEIEGTRDYHGDSMVFEGSLAVEKGGDEIERSWDIFSAPTRG